tara:strand:+ start:128 stop:739 length:612 start_codon:yes stop_codon:yes gene_type:complete
MKQIIITQRLSINDKIKEKRDSIDIKLINLLLKVHLHPVPIPNLFCTLKKKHFNNFVKKINPSGLILTGGENFGVNKPRDKLEKKLLQHFSLKRKPILGICRGAQMIAKFFGVNLVKVKKHVGVNHKTIIATQDKLFPKVINSFHEYGIKRCPKNFITTVLHKDNTIEAFKHKKFKWEGWMWHPEREKTFSTESLKRIKKIFS